MGERNAMPLPYVLTNLQWTQRFVGVCKFTWFIQTPIICWVLCIYLSFFKGNGDPTDPNSLHHFSASGSRPNPYEQAIQAVGEIIQDYDQSKTFPAYGFGARVPPSGEVRHNFPVTLTENPFCNGIDGVMDAYRLVSLIKTKKLYIQLKL